LGARPAADSLGDFLYVGDLVDEPGIDRARRHHVGDGCPRAQGLVDGMEAAVVRDGAAAQQVRRVAGRFLPAERGAGGLHRAQGLLQRLGKLRPDRHGLAHRFHVVVSSGSAPGNFSNANRGALTTT
jgi:hypothetical protein